MNRGDVRPLVQPMLSRPIAHQGLHSPGVPRNTLAAFQRAVERGTPIELDVQMSADGELVVFHDDDLGGSTGHTGRIDQHTANELAGLQVGDSGRGIPRLVEALDLIRGRVPILIEIKHGRREFEIGSRVLSTLKTYPGPIAILSFNPLLVRWFRSRRPAVARVLVTSSLRHLDRDLSLLVRILLLSPLALLIAWPDILAYDIRAKSQRLVPRLAKVLNIPVIAWTVRSPAELLAIGEGVSNFIFEGFEPGS